MQSICAQASTSATPATPATHRVIELFAGVGGFHFGLEQANQQRQAQGLPRAFDVVYANQWEPKGKHQHAARVYEAQFALAPVCRDLMEVLDDSSEMARIHALAPTMLVGGFPCQDYSVAKPSSKSEGTDTIPHLNIEVLPGGLIRLENESMGDSYTVDLHPVQLRHIAEKAGLIESCDHDAENKIATLQGAADRYKRALLAIKVRAEQLHDNIFNCSQRGHEDLGIEVAQSAALADFAEYVCFEFENDFTADEPGNNAAGLAELAALGAKAVKQQDTEPRQLAIPA